MSKLPAVVYEVQNIDGVGLGKKGERCRIIQVRWVFGRKEIVDIFADDLPCEEADAKCEQLNKNSNP